MLASDNCLLGVVFLAITSLLWGAVLSALYVVVAPVRNTSGITW